MEMFYVFLISLMPMLATVPLALGAVAIVALLVSRRLRDALGEWAASRLRSGARDDERAAIRSAVLGAERRALAAEARVDALERRLDAGGPVRGESPARRPGHTTPVS